MIIANLLLYELSGATMRLVAGDLALIMQDFARKINPGVAKSAAAVRLGRDAAASPATGFPLHSNKASRGEVCGRRKILTDTEDLPNGHRS